MLDRCIGKYTRKYAVLDYILCRVQIVSEALLLLEWRPEGMIMGRSEKGRHREMKSRQK